MDTNLYLADYYYGLLETLSRKEKLRLAERLMNSLSKKEATTDEAIEAEKDAAFRRLAGIWADDPEAETMADAISAGRTNVNSRHLASFDE